MWRSLRFALPNSKVSVKCPHQQTLYSTSTSIKRTGKVIFGIVASTGIGFSGAIVYGKYEPKFKSVLEEYIPFVSNVYNMFPNDVTKSPMAQRGDFIEKVKDTEEGTKPSISKIKFNKENESISKVPKLPFEKSKTSVTGHCEDDSHTDKPNVLESETTELAFESTEIKNDVALHEKALNDTISKLKNIFEETINVHKNAKIAVKTYTEKLHESFDLPEGDDDTLRKETNLAKDEKEKMLILAKKKAMETRYVIEKVKNYVKKLSEHTSSPLLKDGEKVASKYLSELLKIESEVATAEKEAKIAAEYEQIVKTSKEKFKKEVMPDYLQGDKAMTEGDLNILMAHAYHRIEQLQKQIAELQVNDETVQHKNMQDEKQGAVDNRVASLKAKFEAEFHQHLLRQIAAHLDHLQEALKIQEKELERKHVLELEEKLLHQKKDFISEISGNIARLKRIMEYLKAKSQFDESTKKTQALWLACQVMNYKITQQSLRPLANDIKTLKKVDEENEFVNSVVASIPITSVRRGVFSSEILKQRFEKVKSACKSVALVDENNDNLYRYILSYLQSFLIIDYVPLSKNELESKVGFDVSELDTFDILQLITYCLKIDDLEQALRYANLLRGEPKVVAKDWMNEVKLLLETQLAVKALLAHAASVSVQAYH